MFRRGEGNKPEARPFISHSAQQTFLLSPRNVTRRNVLPGCKSIVFVTLHILPGMMIPRRLTLSGRSLAAGFYLAS